MRDLLRGIRHWQRGLLRAPGFTAAALGTLALGIGATTAMFSVVYGVVLRPLPFEQSHRLVAVWSTAPGIGWPHIVLAPAQYYTYREQTRAFEDIAVYGQRSVSVTGAGEPEQVPVLMVTDGLLPLLRVQPLLGRRFTKADDTAGSPERVMLTHGYWQRRFGGDRSVIGRHLVVNGTPREVIGVLPARFRFLDADASMLVPFQWDRAGLKIEDFSYVGVARLRDGATLEQANADVSRMIPLVRDRFPMSPGLSQGWFEEARLGPDVHPLSEDAARGSGELLWVLLGMVGIVLLIACANVANLFLVRAEGRQHELAVRSALGATSWQIAKALLSESVALALAAGAIGVGLAYWGIQLLTALAPDRLPRIDEVALDGPALLFALAISIASGVLFGAIPTARYARPRAATLKDSGRSVTGGRERQYASRLLVVAEIALALVLLVASGLMVRTFVNLRGVSPGFTDAGAVLAFDIAVPKVAALEPADVTRLHEQIERAVERVPGVVSVGMTSGLTLEGGSNNPVHVEDFPAPPGQPVPMRRMKFASPGYFATMGNPLVAGRDLGWADIYACRPVVVVTENFAREHWKSARAAIGRRIRESQASPWREIVGVVGDEHDDGLARPATATVYLPLMAKDYWAPGTFAQRHLVYAVRSRRLASPTFLKEVQRAVWNANPGLPVANVRTLEHVVRGALAESGFALALLALAAAVALVLSLVGIYGVVAYITSRRTREVGIRMALGAQQGDVARLFVRHGVALALAGLALGLGSAAAVSRLMATLLFGVSPIDPLTYGLVSSVLGGVALAAGYLPARRASRLDPVTALRADA